VEAEVLSLHSEGDHLIQDIEVKLQVTLKLNEDWVSNQTTEQLIDNIKTRLNNSLGRMGHVRRLNVITRK
jgi:hypothetical protein